MASSIENAKVPQDKTLTELFIFWSEAYRKLEELRSIDYEAQPKNARRRMLLNIKITQIVCMVITDLSQCNELAASHLEQMTTILSQQRSFTKLTNQKPNRFKHAV